MTRRLHNVLGDLYCPFFLPFYKLRHEGIGSPAIIFFVAAVFSGTGGVRTRQMREVGGLKTHLAIHSPRLAVILQTYSPPFPLFSGGIDRRFYEKNIKPRLHTYPVTYLIILRFVITSGSVNPSISQISIHSIYLCNVATSAFRASIHFDLLISAVFAIT